MHAETTWSLRIRSPRLMQFFWFFLPGVRVIRSAPLGKAIFISGDVKDEGCRTIFARKRLGLLLRSSPDASRFVLEELPFDGDARWLEP